MSGNMSPEELASTIDALIKLDEVYAGIEKELNDKVAALRKEYAPKLSAVLADRKVTLTKSGNEKAQKGTPAVPGFWLEVLGNSEEFGQEIEEYDEEVLEYLDSIEALDIDPTDEDKGFVLQFSFAENPFFTNKTITKTYTTARASDFTDQLEIVSIECDEINWNAGKDVTVEIVAKKKSGGGAKKKKQAAAKTEPRPSFFRFFRSLDADNLPVEMTEEHDDEEEEDMDELEQLQMFMQDDWERAMSLKDLIVPRAVRWFTGEAVEIDYEEESDLEDEDESEDEESEDEEPVKAVGGKKNLFPAAAKGAANPEECKQQ